MLFDEASQPCHHHRLDICISHSVDDVHEAPQVVLVVAEFFDGQRL
jgi:hypothetical protein